MKLFALYLSSRRRTVNNTSRAGRMNANVLARRAIWNAASTGRTGAKPIAAKPKRLSTGIKRRVTVTPRNFISRPEIPGCHGDRSEEHTSELQSHLNLVCRLLLE